MVAGIPVFASYEEALANAKALDKPILLDFTGYACVNCRKMEANVWSDSEVSSLMSNKFVVASLHVDDKTPVDSCKSEYSGKNIETIGQRYSDLQMSKYGNSTQPDYYILDLEENVLMQGANYSNHNTPIEFLSWLQKGLTLFHKQN